MRSFFRNHLIIISLIVLVSGISQSTTANDCSDNLRKSGHEQNFDNRIMALDPHRPGEPLLYNVTSVKKGGVDKYHVFEPLIADESLSFDIVSAALKNSDKILFFDPDSVVENIQIEPGESFTTNLHMKKLIILAGRNILGSSGEAGSSGSHDNLAFLLGKSNSDYEVNLIAPAGSIRINKDGSIDISGYSSSDINWSVAFSIAKLISRIVTAKIRITGDRLSVFNESIL